MADNDDAFLQRLEDAMRAAFFPGLTAPPPATKEAEAEVLDKLASRYPTLFGQAARNNLDLNTVPDQLSQLTREWGSPVMSAAQADRLEAMAQRLQELPLNDRDRDSAESIAHSVRQIKNTTNHISQQMSSMIPMLKSMTEFIFSDKLDRLADPSLSATERASSAISVFEEMRNLPGLNDGIAELERAGITGFSDLVNKRLDSFMGRMRDFQQAAQRPTLPDLGNVEEFIYQPLSTPTSIRVLRVEGQPSGSDTNPNCIKLRIEEVDLARNPDFNALSYVWGDHRPPLGQNYSTKRAARCFNILCNGRRMAVTYNLFCFLRRLAAAKEGDPLYSVSSGALWADQLCINQSDNAEKVVQVAMMDRVYSQASTVVSWLGEGDSHTEGAARLLGKLAGIPRSTISRPDFDVAQFVKDTPSGDWLALGAFLARPYFRRAWIVQEIAMAGRLLVVCGEHVVSWEDLVHCSWVLEESKAWTMLSRYVSVFRSVKDQISSALQPLRFGGHLAALLEAQTTIRDSTVPAEHLLLLGKQFDATVPADKFFAMLGLHRRRLGEADSSGLLTVDYSKTVQDVALGFAKYHVQSSGSLGILSLVEDAAYRTPNGNDFPSWLPDPAAPLLPMPFDGVTLRHTTRPRKAPVVKGTSLIVQGRHLDTIAHTAPPFTTLAETDEWSELFTFLLSPPHPGPPNLGPEGKSSTPKLGQALWRTLIAADQSPGSGSTNLDAEFGAWCISLVAGVRNRNRRMLDPMTAETTQQAYRLDDTEFDMLAFGKDAGAILAVPDNGDGESAADAVLRSSELRYDYMEKREAERTARGGARDDAELASRLERALRSAWEVEKDADVFPSPKQVREGLEVLGLFLVEEETAAKREMEHRIDTFKAALGMKLEGRRLFWTKDGRLGMGSVSVKEGDEVWVMDGVRPPVALRRKDGGGFAYIGQTYVFGAMDGKLLQEHGGLVDVVLE
ncbi:Heterokaryon incompatibility protein-domain-containing protein [Madurella fahalii]|uniref:Heterokaryon incompatibility protein-domain-containing protein n=1 Tax=Madurella fahalii TaxID=1157608 RepID=A0ABQ0GHK7_9PEZI